MIVSMTGFGDAAAERDGTHYAVEIRSLNNRFFKAVLKLPDNVSGLEPEIENLLRQSLGRGSITFVLKMRMDSAEAAYHINTQALTAYLQQLQSVPALNKTATIDLGSLLQLPGVCQEPRDESDEIGRHGGVIRELTAVAIAKLIAMRLREGQALMTDLLRHTKLVASHLAEIQLRAPHVIEDYHKKLTQRVNLLLSKAELQVNQTDLLKEVAVFAERADISEEIQRLTSHLDAFEHSCRDSEHEGRKLDFIVQEMLREANTIASKANDAQIAKHIVEIKGAIDRLKEQVQNVEQVVMAADKPKRGVMLVLCGPSGVGKSTISHALSQKLDIPYVSSATTRSKRPGDEKGKKYEYLTQEEFFRRLDKDDFLEYAEIYGDYYGTPKHPAVDDVEAGKDVLLEIEIQGALQVRFEYPQCLTVFILPPDEPTLLRRLQGRARDSEQEITKRFRAAKREIHMAKGSGAFDHMVINDDLNKAVEEIVQIMQRKRSGDK